MSTVNVCVHVHAESVERHSVRFSGGSELEAKDTQSGPLSPDPVPVVSSEARGGPGPVLDPVRLRPPSDGGR